MDIKEKLNVIKGDLADVIISRGEFFEEKRNVINTFLLTILRKHKLFLLQSRYDKAVMVLVKNLFSLVEELERNKKDEFHAH